MSLSPARLTRAAIFAAAVVLAAVTVAGCQPLQPSPQPTASPTPTGSPAAIAFEVSAPCPDPSCTKNQFICAGGTDCRLLFRWLGCLGCQPKAIDYKVMVMNGEGLSEVKSGHLVFAVGERTAILRFQASAAVTRAEVEVSVDGVVVDRQTLTAPAA